MICHETIGQLDQLEQSIEPGKSIRNRDNILRTVDP